MSITTELLETFNKSYGAGAPPALFFCPGRVNLIGEHIDYNGGPVFPSAISQGIYAAVRFNSSGKVRLRSTEKSETIELRLEDIPAFERRSCESMKEWVKYPVGMLSSLKQNNLPIASADILFSSDLPIGAGVSSSAAMEVLTGYIFLQGPERKEIDRTALALRGNKVEREFVGVNCGVMDQFSVAQGRKGQAILLNCATLDFRYVPFKLDDLRLVIMNTNKARELAGSKYNERRAECETALGQINAARLKCGQAEARDLCSAALSDIEKFVTDQVVRRRAKHVISERDRVGLAVTALEKGDITGFGRLMNDSHASLKSDYEVTGVELDSIVAAAQSHRGCRGARMTGAGFGGCAIALVTTSEVEDFTKKVGQQYQAATGLTASFIAGESAGGVDRIG